MSSDEEDKTTIQVFVTVGSTKFTALVQAILSSPVLEALSQAAFESGASAASVTVQFGSTPIQDILFADKLGLQLAGGEDISEGSVPIKLLGNDVESGNGIKPATADDIDGLIKDLSPNAIRQQLADGTEEETFAGLHHFSLERDAEHGKVQFEFIDYIGNIKSYMESSDLVISHAGEWHPRDTDCASDFRADELAATRLRDAVGVAATRRRAPTENRRCSQ